MLGNLEIPDHVKKEIMAKLGITPIQYCEISFYITYVILGYIGC